MPARDQNGETRENVRRLKRRIERPRPDLAKNRREIREHFKRRADRLEVVKTTRTPSGQTLDWIAIESQHPRGKIADPPSDSVPLEFGRGKRKDRALRFELEHPDVERGPEGTVPVRRKDLRRVPSSKSLKEYLSKHGRKTYEMRLNERDSIQVPGDGSVHDYAYTSQGVTCYGGDGYLSAYDPYTQWSDEFSLLQIALVRGSGSGKQTVEGGWQEYRDLYGDWLPHLFVYYTTNGYTDDDDDVGGYNQDVDGWVQYSGSIYPEATSSPNSTRGGSQYVMQIKYQLYQGNWWFCCNGHWIGYYPASLFSTSGLRSKADKVTFYGEIVDSSDHGGSTKSDMGSGYWPDYEWPWAAYQRNLRYQSSSGGSMTTYKPDTVWAGTPDMYDLIAHIDSGSNWGSYFWLGGPGAG